MHNTKDFGVRSGCYFCNDYLSPTNTLRDRTLDQQCTVTRPGLSFVSSAYASELLVNYLHAKQEDFLQPGVEAVEETSMGKLPQHIRGNVGGFDTQIMFSSAFEHCLACGKNVVEEYMNNREEFMAKALTDPDYLQVRNFFFFNFFFRIKVGLKKLCLVLMMKSCMVRMGLSSSKMISNK